ncbi:hypothetical protein HIV01_004555 [Lysobacter arenosi]|uniref:Uncharacterized protein n=1 Tax=Lysobacter arenosi TaxID=2795387 RepID=A0ABX7RCB5_9GAMM|nr:hypothetical protein [Lysobacter arenosi]QSX75798.1 hypothetical protein HIV01_004555 [Lysobacter arenosi]
MRSPSLRLRVSLAAAAFVAAAAATLTAGAAEADSLGEEWVAIDPALLEDMRGGFQTANGMSLSFGIERVVYVNGELLASTRVNIPDIGRMTQAQAQELADFNQGQVIQVGEGNTFEPSANFNGLLVQNTRNDQDIRALTTVNVGVDTLSAFQDLNTQQALQNAMVAATSP